jgi:hypothetical protein
MRGRMARWVEDQRSSRPFREGRKTTTLWRRTASSTEAGRAGLEQNRRVGLMRWREKEKRLGQKRERVQQGVRGFSPLKTICKHDFNQLK